MNEIQDCSGYTVRLRKASGSRDPWPELEQQGKAFVVGTPGQGYIVSVGAPTAAFGKGQILKV